MTEPVPAVESALGWLLDPLAVPAFLERIWGATHHHIQRRHPGYFDRMLDGSSAVDRLLTGIRAAPSAVRLVQGADHRRADEHQLADGTLDLTRVRNQLDNGYTVILNNIERYLRPFAELTHSIEVELNFPTHVNAYITPPHAVGFLPHYDHHDVLALQIQGSKTWYFYGDEPVPPHVMQQLYEVDPAGLAAPRDKLQLAAGDTLYLPRGQVHSAQASTDLSVHLTVGIHVPTVLTLLTHALHLLSLRDDLVHTRLPPRHFDDPQVRTDLDAVIQAAVSAVADPDAVDEGLSAMQDFLVRRGRCPLVGHVGDAVGIDSQVLVRKHQPLYSRVTTAPGGVALQFAQLLVKAGPDHEAAMRFLSSSTEPFRVGDLPGLTAAQQAELTRSLLLSGFLIRMR